MNEDQILDALYNVGHSHDVESAVRGLLASAWDEGYGAGQEADRAAALADMTNDEADAVDRFMGEHMYRHSISNNINGMSCGVGCRTRALAEAFRREVLIPRRAAAGLLANRAAAEDHGLRAVGPVCTDPECPIYERHRRQGRTFPPHGPHDFRAAMGDDK